MAAIRLFFLWLLVIVLEGCSTLPPLRSTAHFLAYPPAPHVRYEPGGEAYAQELTTLLPAAIQQVEAKHYRPFRQPPDIFICATLSCFAAYVKTPNLSAAVVANNRLFLTPKLFKEERARLPSILQHELSHLHFGQQLGHFTSAVPVWFHEGFATYVANGGGADSISDQAALAAAKAGIFFFPQHRNSRHLRQYAQDLALPIHLFYRQAQLFISYLQRTDDAAFTAFVLDLQDGEEFYLAFYRAYNTDLATVADKFLLTLGAMPVAK